MNSSQTLVDLLEQRAAAADTAEQGATLAFDGCSFQRLHAEALRLAQALRARGLAGERLLLCSNPGVDYARGLLACLYAGVVAVPAYPPARKGLSRAQGRIAAIARDADLRYALTAHPELLDPALGLETLTELELIAATRVSAAARNWPLDPDATCLLQYTSGSTAAPKGVMLSLRQLSANLRQIQRASGVNAADVHVTWLPPYHDMGLLGGILMPLFVGARGVIMTPEAFLRRPRRWLELIGEQRATTTAAPNFAFELCLRRIPEHERAGLDLSSLRLVFNGAEPIDAETLERFACAFEPHGFSRQAFYPCYGLAEATLFLAGGQAGRVPTVRAFDREALQAHRAEPAADSERAMRLVSCGAPAADTRVAVVALDSAAVLPEGQVGEIWASGPSVASGYWRRPTDTEATFRGELRDEPARRFLRTGDLGFLHAGELFVSGRRKDLIIVRGQNHYPHDVERTVQAVDADLLPGCGAAFSIPLHAEEQLVVVQELDRRGGELAPERLIERVLESIRLHHELSVHALLLVKRGSLAKTASGKIQHRAIREAFLQGALEAVVVARFDRELVDPARPEEQALRSSSVQLRPVVGEREAEITRFLCARIAAYAGLRPELVDVHAPLARYGLDSLASEEITHELEQFLGESLPPTLSYDHPTVAALARALARTGEAATVGRQTAMEPASSDQTGAAPDRTYVRRAPMPHAAASDKPSRATQRADREIAIVGMSCRFPGAPDLSAYWRLLCEGQDAVSEVSAARRALGLSPSSSGRDYGGFIEDIDAFDAGFFGISAREAARMDPQQRIFLEQAWRALENAGIPPSSLAKTDCGVFVGSCTNDYALLHGGDLERIDADYGTGHAASVIANRLSYALDLRGPSMTVDTACSSALVALHLACQSLLSGESQLAIVGGVNAVLAPDAGVFLRQAGALARDGRCKTFDRRADGFVRSEGCGVIVLRSLSAALEQGDPIHALIESSVVNHDGTSNGLMAPSGPAQERLLCRALERAGIGPEALDYVEAHGVGTALSDAVELQALARVLGGGGRVRPCRVGSVKTNLGHLEAASGMASLIKTVLALSHERIPAHLHVQEPLPGVDGQPLEIAYRASDWKRGLRPRFAGISTFGFGGTNAHAIVREAPLLPRREVPRADRPVHALLISAKHPQALRERALALTSLLAETSGPGALANVCHSANAGSDHFAHRAGFVAESSAALRAQLVRFAAGSASHVSLGRPARIAWMFGTLAPKPELAHGLMRLEPAFRRGLERGARVIAPLLGADPLEGWLQPFRSGSAGAGAVVPPLAAVQTFLLQRALCELLESWGLYPSAVFGRGIGEYAAACAAGALAWDDAAELVARRELLLASLVPGAPVQQTLHRFKRALDSLSPASTQLPLRLASRTQPLAVGAAFAREHWLEHLYATSAPELDATALRALGAELVLELSGGDSHSSDGSDPIARADWLACSAGEPGREHHALMGLLTRLYECGVDADWRAVDAPFRRHKLGLPGYPFQRQRYWLELTPRTAALRPAPAPARDRHPFLRASAAAGGDDPVR